MVPSAGRIVHYVLNESDADHANRRRTDGGQIRKMMAKMLWPAGAQAHIGNPARAGDVLPMMIVKVNKEGIGSVNGQVFLDGCDVLWVTSREQVATDSTDKQGLWFEPPRVAPVPSEDAKALLGDMVKQAQDKKAAAPPPPADAVPETVETAK